jgi:hypothetical protein
MHTFTTTSTSPADSALTTLLTRYVNGQIGSDYWKQLMSIFDASDVTAQERLAMATFFDDVIGEAGTDARKIPLIQEATELLGETRIN